MTSYLPSIVLILVAIIGVVGTWLNSKNDRARTQTELEILAKLNPESPEYTALSGVISLRLGKWYRRVLPHRELRKIGLLNLGWAYLMFILILAYQSKSSGPVMTEATLVKGLGGLAVIGAVLGIVLMILVEVADQRASRNLPSELQEPPGIYDKK